MTPPTHTTAPKAKMAVAVQPDTGWVTKRDAKMTEPAAAAKLTAANASATGITNHIRRNT